MGKLALKYIFGEGVEKDELQAATWFRRAADLGDGFAMFNLAYMYEVGQGVEMDYGKAKSWYDKAAPYRPQDVEAAIERLTHKRAAEQSRLDEERKQREKAEADRLEQEERDREAAEQARLKEERKQRDQAEAARLVALAEAERKQREQAEAARLAARAEAEGERREEAARLVALAEAERRREEAARLAAQAELERKQRDEAAHLAAQAEADRKQREEAARLAAQAEAERKQAVERARLERERKAAAEQAQPAEEGEQRGQAEAAGLAALDEAERKQITERSRLETESKQREEEREQAAEPTSGLDVFSNFPIWAKGAIVIGAVLIAMSLLYWATSRPRPKESATETQKPQITTATSFPSASAEPPASKPQGGVPGNRVKVETTNPSKSAQPATGQREVGSQSGSVNTKTSKDPSNGTKATSPQFIDDANRRESAPIVVKEGYWADPTTRLMWVRHDSGSDYSWESAASYCRNLGTSGFRDWRLPTMHELITDLANAQSGELNLSTYKLRTNGLTKLTGNMVWSSGKGALGISVLTTWGQTELDEKSSAFAVCVRSYRAVQEDSLRGWINRAF